MTGVAAQAPILRNKETQVKSSRYLENEQLLMLSLSFISWSFQIRSQMVQEICTKTEPDYTLQSYNTYTKQITQRSLCLWNMINGLTLQLQWE